MTQETFRALVARKAEGGQAVALEQITVTSPSGSSASVICSRATSRWTWNTPPSIIRTGWP